MVLDRETEAPPAGAAFVRETVQVLEELGPRLVANRPVKRTVTEAKSLMLALSGLPSYRRQ